MFKYGNSFAIAANPFRNLKFVITFVNNTKVKRSTNLKPWWTIRICVSCKFQIWPNNFWCLHIYCLTPNLSMNWQNLPIDSHIQTLQMHCECICADFKFGTICRGPPLPATAKLTLQVLTLTLIKTATNTQRQSKIGRFHLPLHHVPSHKIYLLFASSNDIN